MMNLHANVTFETIISTKIFHFGLMFVTPAGTCGAKEFRFV